MNRQGFHLLHYLFAAGLALVATVANLTLAGPLGGPTLLLPATAATLAGLYGGVGAGLFAAALSLAGHDFFVQQPPYSFYVAQRSDLYRLGVLAAVGSMMAVVAGNLRRAVRRAQAEKARAQQSADSLALSHAVVAALASASTKEEVTRAIFEKGFAALGARTMLASRLVETDRLNVVQAVGFPGRTASNWERFPITAPLPYAEAVHTGESVWVESLEELERRYPVAAETARTTNAGAWACVPIPSQSRIIGSICIGFAEGRRFTDPDKRVLESFAATCGQALERSQLEERLRAQFAALSSMFDALNLVVYVADLQSYDLLFVNSYTEQLFGPGWAGRRCYEYLQTGQGGPCSFCTNDRLVRNGLPQPPQVWECQNTINGRWYLCIDRAIPWVDGRLVRLEAAVDIAERKQAENALRDADRRKNEFLGVLSHELRNPLAPIRNALYILDRVPPDGEAAARAKAVIDRQVGHLTRLVDDLLDVTRISRGKIALQRTRVDLGTLVRRTVEDHKPIFATGNLRLDLRLADWPLWVDGDPTRLAQIMGNLLLNATKFTESGGCVSVEVGRDANSAAIVRVRDDGVGIAPEMQRRLFEPFAQADDTLHRNRGGLGLGLALVKGLVGLHQGTIEAHSDGPGRGAEFTIRLPLAEAPEAIAQPLPARNVGPRRVLVIEDNVDAAEMLRVFLELGHHEVAVAHTGREGVEEARKLRPDVVLCDLGLPEMDGFEVARAIRADASLRSTVLVALTGYASVDDQQRAAEVGFQRHIKKPASLDQLEEALLSAPAASRGVACD